MKLKELLENTTLSQKEMKKFYNSLEEKESIYIKKPNSFDFEIAKEKQKMDTIIDGKKETSKTVNKGEYIITGSKGEKYAISSKKFKERYTIVKGKAKTKPVEVFGKKYSGKPISFMASWGEEMILEPNDFIIKNTDDEFYRIEKESFSNTYKKK